jgi:hypothetical protein
MRPLTIIGIGFVGVLFGLVASLLMVLQIVPASFWLCFLSFAASVAGVFLGLIGTAWYTTLHRKQD